MKTANGYPSDLGMVTEKLGGALLRSSYDGSALVCKSLENGKGFSIAVEGTSVGEVELPEIKFEHLPAAPAAP